MTHFMMLSRNLLYTGLTRAKQLAVIVGQEKAIGVSVKQVKSQQRYTLLNQRLVRAVKAFWLAVKLIEKCSNKGILRFAKFSELQPDI